MQECRKAEASLCDWESVIGRYAATHRVEYAAVHRREGQGADSQVVPRQCVQHSAICRVKDSHGAVHGGARHSLPV